MQPSRKKLSDLAMCATQHHELLKNCCSSLLLQKKNCWNQIFLSVKLRLFQQIDTKKL